MNAPTHQKKLAIAKPSKVVWSLRDLFLLMALLSGLFAILAFVGLEPYVLSCFVLSGILAAACISLMPGKSPLAPFIAVSVAAFVMLCALMLFSIAMFFNCFVHALWILWPRNQRPNMKQALLSTLLITMISFVIGVGMGTPIYIELIKLRAQYPVADLSPRLEYELVGLENQNPNESDMSLVVQGKWWVFEDSYKSEAQVSERGKADLRGLHNDSVEAFIKSSGFGFGRISPRNPTRMDFSIDQLKDVDFEFEYGVSDKEGFHFRNVLDFLDPHTTGIEYEEGKRIGFDSHAIRRPLKKLENDSHTIGHLQSLELVSLLKFESPRVYLLDHLPRMDQLSSDTVEKRPLNEFETMALEKLRKGAVIVSSLDSLDSDSRPDKMFALGGIVAIESCLDCHSVKKGELLGAFTYEFKLAPTNGLSDH